METKMLQPIPISTGQLYWRIRASRAKSVVTKFLSRAPQMFLTSSLEVLMTLSAVTVAIIVGTAIGAITVMNLVIDWGCKQINEIRTLK